MSESERLTDAEQQAILSFLPSDGTWTPRPVMPAFDYYLREVVRIHPELAIEEVRDGKRGYRRLVSSQ